MKRLTLLFGCSFFLFGACQKKAAGDGTLSVRMRDCAARSFDGETVRICYDSLLQDSRCPTYAVCVWAGVAQVKLTVRIGSGAYPVVLSTLKAPGYVRDTIVRDYRITLEDVKPYPGDSTFLPARVALLSVVRR